MRGDGGRGAGDAPLCSVLQPALPAACDVGLVSTGRIRQIPTDTHHDDRGAEPAAHHHTGEGKYNAHPLGEATGETRWKHLKKNEAVFLQHSTRIVNMWMSREGLR